MLIDENLILLILGSRPRITTCYTLMERKKLTIYTGFCFTGLHYTYLVGFVHNHSKLTFLLIITAH